MLYANNAPTPNAVRSPPLCLLSALLCVAIAVMHGDGWALEITGFDTGAGRPRQEGADARKEPAGEVERATEPLGTQEKNNQCPQFYVDGAGPRVLNPVALERLRLLCFSNFGIGYSALSRTPLWSAERLSAALLQNAKGLKRVNAFHEEERLAPDDRAWLRDYARSGYDRGHMSPSADQPTELAQQESFSLANMVPQNPNNNRHLWEGIESATRALAKSSGPIFVITGPLFIGEHIEQLHRRVLVPTHIFKLIYIPAKKAAGVYLVDNQDTSEYSVISVAQLNKMARIDFLPSLSEQQKQSKMALPTPTPHLARNDTAQELGRAGAHQRSTENGPSAQEEFREVEHLLKEIPYWMR